jgi:exodeoxyribonuclease-3
MSGVRVVTLNANGLRAAARKGFHAWLASQEADVCCLQEVRLTENQLEPGLLPPPGWQAHWNFAQRPGYSGVAIWTRQPPARVSAGLGAAEFDAEGRVLAADFDNLRIVSLYLPSGSSSPERQEAKYRFMAAFAPWLRLQLVAPVPVLVCGDWNIAHTARDIKNARGNAKNSGFLPEERAWLGGLLGEGGWRDVWRELHPEEEGTGYTWWSQRGAARAKNVGWRIDYQIASAGLASRARRSWVEQRENFSDHAPLLADFDLQLMG